MVMSNSNPFLDDSNSIQVVVSQLKMGMFVAKLDRPWIETPFLMQGFVITKTSEIRKLAEYCDYVYVEKEGRGWAKKDTAFERGGVAAAERRDPLGRNDKGKILPGGRGDRRTAAQTLVQGMAQRPVYGAASKQDVDQEHTVARSTYKTAKGSVKGILQQVRLGNMIDSEVAKNTVSHCVDSILRNPAALIWMTRMKNMNEYTSEHCLNVCILAIAFGRHLRLPEEELEHLGLCGLMHDVGKMRIPDEVLDKPGVLTEEEMEIMRSHPEEGRNALMKDKDMATYVIDAVYNHHEQVDAQGYPRGLNPAQISQYTRIISIVDAFDAMTSDRCYSRAKSNLGAQREIYKNRGGQFDEELALEFIQLVGPYPPGTIVELRNKSVGIVLGSEAKARHLPRIRIVQDEDGTTVESYDIDLSRAKETGLDRGFMIKDALKNGERGVKLEDFPVRHMLRSHAEQAAQNTPPK